MLNRTTKAGLLLAGLLLVFGKLFYDLYGGMTDPLRINMANDLTHHIWPFYAYTSESVRAGIFPLWNLDISVGNSLIGELGIGLFHPTNWTIFFFDDVPTAMLISQLLTVLISAVGAYLYSRYLGLQWPARILCTMLFGYAAVTESFSQTGGASSCWFALIMYFAHRCFDRPTVANALCISVALALCFFGGFANFFLYTCLIVGVFFSTLAVFSRPAIRLEGFVRRFALIILSVILMAGFIAIQLLPAYELSTFAERNLNSTSAYNPNSFWEQVSASLVFANFVLPDHNFIFGNNHLKTDTGYLYLSGALVLIPYAFKSMQYRATAIALTTSGLLIVCIVLSSRISALSFIHDIPFFGSLRLHSRGITYIQYILILLAALGVSTLASERTEAREPGSKLAQTFGTLFTVAFAIGISAAAVIVGNNPVSIAGLLLCSGMVIFHALSHMPRPVVLAWVVVTIIIVDLSIHREHRYLIPAFSNEIDPFVEQSARDYHSRNDHYRTLLVIPHSVDDVATANSGMIMGVPNINAYDPFAQTRWRNYIRGMIGPEKFDSLISKSILQWFYGYLTPPILKQLAKNDRILGLASLRYLYSPDGNTINEHALPRAYAVHRYINTASEEQSIAAIKANIEILDESVVLENAAPGYSAPEGRGTSDESVAITRYTPNEVELSVNVSRPAIAVLTDAFYPGWVAAVDGRETTIFRANSLFRAVEVPAGNHSVVFRYRPTSLYMGAAISLVSVCTALLLVFTARRRRACNVDEPTNVMTNVIK